MVSGSSILLAGKGTSQQSLRAYSRSKALLGVVARKAIVGLVFLVSPTCSLTPGRKERTHGVVWTGTGACRSPRRQAIWSTLVSVQEPMSVWSTLMATSPTTTSLFGVMRRIPGFGRNASLTRNGWIQDIAIMAGGRAGQMCWLPICVIMLNLSQAAIMGFSVMSMGSPSI